MGHCIEAGTRQIEKVTIERNNDGTLRSINRTSEAVTVTADITFRVEFSRLYSRVDGGQRTDFYGHRETRMATATAPGSPVITSLRSTIDTPDTPDTPDVYGEGETIDPPDLEYMESVQDTPDQDTPAYTVDPAVITKVEELASQTQHGTAHVNRWQRVLVAFGVLDAAGVQGGAITLAEAQENANRYSSPVWNLVVAELTALEASQ